ncbi:MAG: VOC family protein [Rhodobacteraceae bacterium]|nr:VOC family protein [Paracoccaceae bacterium]
MKFGYTIIYVENVEATLEFYQQAFGFARKMLYETGGYGELETGNTTLAFASFSTLEEMGMLPKVMDANAPSFEVAFTTNNVTKAAESAVAAGAALVSAPQDMPWGQTVAYVSDITGGLVELCTPIAP